MLGPLTGRSCGSDGFHLVRCDGRRGEIPDPNILERRSEVPERMDMRERLQDAREKIYRRNVRFV
jgi:hypothetical protein